MAMRIFSLAAVILLCGAPLGFPKGSGVIKNDPWNPHHIAGLPAEVRQYIAGICKGPLRAQHDFATYSPQEKALAHQS